MREAAATGQLKMTGSKWSFKNPLRVVLPKSAANSDAANE